MDEEIEASPTSQRKRKKVSRRRAIKKMSTTGVDNLESVVNQNTEDIEDGDYSFRTMWQSAYLLEENDRVQFVPKNGLTHRSLGGEFRMSGPADFLSVSQLCATTAINLNGNEESQWDVTESQFRKVDDAIKESEIKSKQIDNSVQVKKNVADVLNVTARTDDIIADIHSDQSVGSANDGRNSLKRRSSVLESILSEWSSSSPVKIHKTQTEVVQLSPKFKFNRKRCKRTYRRKQNSDESGKLVNDIKKTSPAISPAYRETIRPELCQKANDATNDDDDDFNESMNLVDNIQNLSKFFSQSFETTSVANSLGATQSEALDVRCIDLSESRTSLDDEEDFLGFDGKDLTGGLVSITLPQFFLKCDGQFSAFTLPESFHEFDTDSESSCTPICSQARNAEQLLLMEDDDLFANYQTQLYIPKEEVGFEKPATTIPAGATAPNDDWTHNAMANGARHFQNNSNVPSAEAATEASTRRANIFDDIDKEFGIASNSRNTETSVSVRPQCQDVEYNPIATFAGFSTVSGKQIPVSFESICKKMNIFESATVSEDDAKKVDNWIGDNHQSDEGNSSSGVNFHPGPEFTGFATARGNRIPVSSELILKKTNIFDSVKVTEDELKQMEGYMNHERRNGDTLFEHENPSNESNLEFIPSSTHRGFTTGRGSHITDITITHERQPAASSTIVLNNPNPTLMGFSTAAGKRMPMPSAQMSKRTSIFDDLNITDGELGNMNHWINDFEPSNHTVDDFNPDSRASFTRENQIPTSTNIFQSVNNPNPAFMGFSTAAGNRMPMPSVQISSKIFDDLNVDDDELEKMGHWINEVGHSNNTTDAGSTDAARKMPISRSLFSRSIHNTGDNPTKQWNSTDLFREVTNTPPRESDVVPKKLPVNTLIKPSPMRKMSVMNSLRKWETSKENVGAKPIVSVDENDSGMSNTTSTPTSSRANLCVTPTNNQNTYSQIVRESAAALIEDDELTFANQNVHLYEHTPGFASGFMAELTASSTPINRGDNYRNRLKQRRLVEKFDDIAREDYVESDIMPSAAVKVNVSPHIRSLRATAIEDQQQSITKKTNAKSVPGSLFVNKLTSTRVNWKEFVEHSRPVNQPLTDTNLTSNVLNLTTGNATKFKFNAWDYYSDEFCRENVTGIHLQDDIVVMMDENCQIGIDEISSAFLSCPSVDPKLLHDKWIENHMKWIVIKLAAMERSFPHRFAGKVCTLEHLMLQMKYRYDREIDRAERSAIRKICEMDDVPEKRMILFVAGITKGSSEYEVELSDGWYSLASTLDFGMKRLVNEGRIKIGTKLVIQGANTVNLSAGCHPLDVSANVKLKIHANSTRRARWDSKLGYCKNPGPFSISLRSVWGHGGNITKLRICVLRVYPVVYIDPKNLSDVHSEKVERRRSINEEREKSIIFERIMSEVSRDIEEQESSARFDNRPRKIAKPAELSSITDPVYLCELLDNDKDPERIEGELSNTQKAMVLDYKEKLNCLRNEEINAKVKEKLAAIDKGHRKFVPLLRFKVTDEMFYDKTAIVTVWKPTEEILSLIKEESVFDLTGSSGRRANLSELQIYAGRNANFQKLNVVTRVPKSLLRRQISILEILSIDHLALNELDTTGIVIHVGESFHSLQPVFIADSRHNIVCINFWQSIKEFAYEDILQPKRFLAVKNLQWRKSSNSKPIPCTYATEYTQFIENPQSTELSSALTTLKEEFTNIDLDKFIEICMEKVGSFNLSCPSTPIHSNLSSSLLQSSSSSLQKTPSDFSPRPGRSSLSNQSRIELLSKYGDGMATPPLKIDSLSKSFKLPVTHS